MGQDDWDKKLIERDIRLREAEAAKNAPKPKKSYMDNFPGRKWMGLF